MRRKVKKPKPIHWFLARVGKTIYRDDNECRCDICKGISGHGLLIKDRDHAQYLFEIQYAYAEDGVQLNYRDEK